MTQFPDHRLLKEFDPQKRDLNLLHDHPNPSVKYILPLVSNIERSYNVLTTHREISVIAVHGLAADPVRTWIEKSGRGEEWNWLKNQLIEIIPQARVWTFGYDSSWCGDKSVYQRLSDVADKLSDAIELKKLLPGPLMFVAHSFGGIVVLKALTVTRSTRLFDHTLAVLFFGTPFRGISDWFQDELPEHAKRLTDHVEKRMFETFRKRSDTLHELRNDFLTKSFKYQKPNFGCFWEGERANVGKIVGDENIERIILVDDESATLQEGHNPRLKCFTRSLERNHFNMHNFGKDDRVFATVHIVLEKILPKFLQFEGILKAAGDGDLSSVETILERDPSAISVRNGNRQTALHIAVISKSPAIIRLLCAKGADLGAKDDKNKTPSDYTPPHHEPPYTEISWIFAVGHDLEKRNHSDQTALMYFAQCNKSDTIASLLAQGANKEARNREGYTALVEACRCGHEDVAKQLIKAGADLEAEENEENNTPLHIAATNGSISIIRKLLDFGADVDKTNNHGGTPLIRASRYGKVEAVRLLLSHRRRAAVGIHNNNGFTALTFAAKEGHREIVDLLLSKGDADINEYNQYGMTALCEACRYGHESVVQLLLDRGASLEAQSPAGRTPAIEAEQFRKESRNSTVFDMIKRATRDH